jgi:hypothetical protein
MTLESILSEFSHNRLKGEPMPEDLKALLSHSDEFLERTGIELNWEKNWEPWLDTSYLSDEERADPEIAANIAAIEEVCRLIAFVGATEDGNLFGYWRGPEARSIAESPIVRFDNEGQFDLLAGPSFADAIVVEQTFNQEQFDQLKNWLQSLGIMVRAETPEDADYPEEKNEPNDMHQQLFWRRLGKEPPA